MDQKAIVIERDRAPPAEAARRMGRLVCERPCTVSVCLGNSLIEATLVDLSCFGMMAATPTSILPRAFIDVALPDGIRATGQVRWCRDGAFGVEFSVPLPARKVGPILERHGARPMRLAVWAPVRMMLGDKAHSVVLRDISDHGMQLAGTGSLRPGTRLNIELAPGMALDGTARWSRENRTGLELDNALPAAVREWVSTHLMPRC